MEKTGFAQKNGRLFRLALLVCLSCALFTAKAQTARITLNDTVPKSVSGEG